MGLQTTKKTWENVSAREISYRTTTFLYSIQHTDRFRFRSSSKMSPVTVQARPWTLYNLSRVAPIRYRTDPVQTLDQPTTDCFQILTKYYDENPGEAQNLCTAVLSVCYSRMLSDTTHRVDPSWYTSCTHIGGGLNNNTFTYTSIGGNKNVNTSIIRIRKELSSIVLF